MKKTAISNDTVGHFRTENDNSFRKRQSKHPEQREQWQQTFVCWGVGGNNASGETMTEHP